MDRDEFTRSQETIFEIMADRGYDIFATEKIDYSEIKKGEDVTLVFTDDDRHIAIVWADPSESMVGIVAVQRLAAMEQEEILLIAPANGNSKPNVSASAKSAIALLNKKIQLFSVRELLINITKNRRVPKHTLISPEEELALHKTYGPKSKYNHISISDPVVRYYGWKRGQIVKVTREEDKRIVYRTIL